MGWGLFPTARTGHHGAVGLEVAVLGTVLLAGSGASWWAAWRQSPRLMMVVKPLPMLALLVAAWLLGGDGPRVAVTVALALGLVGDLALLDPPTGAMRPWQLPVGLGAFLLGHLAFLVAVAQAAPGGPPFPWPVVAAGVLGVAVVARWGVPVARAAGRLRVPVAAYEAVLLTLGVAAWARGGWCTALGATSFVASDLLLGRSLFLAATRWSPPVVMATYHAAQTLLTVGLLS